MRKLLITILSCMMLAGAALAEPRWMKVDKQSFIPKQDRSSASRSTRIDLEDAISQVRRETGGRILSASTIRKNGRNVHRIKVLTSDNRVRIINVNAD
jgi:uncharacterized membrane protein YkoI